MSHYFSPSTGACYDNTSKSYVIPGDAVEITAAQHLSLIAAQNSGRVLQLSSAGVPEAVDRVATLAEAQATQTATLRAACAAAITSGFSSSALGAAHAYPSAETDQRNLFSAAASTVASSLWCKDASGAWSFVTHTQAQAQAVLADFNVMRNAAQMKLAPLLAEVSAATTVAAVQAVVW